MKLIAPFTFEREDYEDKVFCPSPFLSINADVGSPKNKIMNITVPKYSKDGLALKAWMDETWAKRFRDIYFTIDHGVLVTVICSYHNNWTFHEYDDEEEHHITIKAEHWRSRTITDAIL